MKIFIKILYNNNNSKFNIKIINIKLKRNINLKLNKIVKIKKITLLLLMNYIMKI